MANPQIYQDELAAFTKKYNLKEYDLTKMQNFDERLSGLDDFLSTSIVGGSPAQQFTSWAARTLRSVVEANVEMNEKGDYLTGFSLKKFTRDFEKLVDAQYRSTLDKPEDYNRKPLNGAEQEDLITRYAMETRKMHKPLPTLWAERMKSGKMEMTFLQSLTLDSMDAIENNTCAPEEIEGKMRNVVAAHEALKQIRESRKGFFGWLWKIFNSERNAIEESSLEMFQNQVERLRNRNYDVDGMAAELTGKTIFGVEVKAKGAKETQPKETESAQEVDKPVTQTNAETAVVNEDSREAVFNAENPFPEGTAPTTTQVQQPPQHQAPTINPNK